MIGTQNFYEKIVVTQGILEVWRYEKLNTKGGGVRDGDGEHHDTNYKQRQRNRRNRIRQLICSNFDSGSKFVTLTFNNSHDFDIRDVKSCNRYFMTFIKRLRYRYPSLKYVAVIEFQDMNGRGAIHYHMICNLPFVKASELQEIWRAGFIKINAIDKVDNVGAYVIKYMCKDTEDVRLCGENAYLHSRGLIEPLQFCTWKGDPDQWRQIHASLEKHSPSYSAKHESEYAGQIEYLQYNFNRDPSVSP